MIALLVFAVLAGLTLTIAQVAVHLPPASKGERAHNVDRRYVGNAVGMDV